MQVKWSELTNLDVPYNEHTSMFDLFLANIAEMFSPFYCHSKFPRWL